MKSIARLALLGCLLAAPAFAQDATPHVATQPSPPLGDWDNIAIVSGFFPSTDYAITGTSISPRVLVPAESAHGANEYEFTATIRYRYGQAGGQALTPYEARFPIGPFTTFARVRIAVQFVADGVPPSPWFRNEAYPTYVYVSDPERPRIEASPAAPTDREPVTLTLRWYHNGYYATRTTHEMIGDVIRIHQDVSYSGPSTDLMSEAQVTHQVGPLPAGNYTIDWRQSSNAAFERTVGTGALQVRFSGYPCEACEGRPATLSLENTTLSFDAFLLGTRGGTQVIQVGPPTDGVRTLGPLLNGVMVQRIWATNMDYLVTHDCPMAPEPLLIGRSCKVTVSFNGTMRGDSPGRLNVRYVDFSGAVLTTAATLSGRAALRRGINFVPPPVTPDEAWEYYAPAVDHYFFTSSGAEKQFVDSGMAGDWRRTNVRFPVGGPADVCRFYGDPLGGPHSHYYTVLAAECAALRALDQATPAGQRALRFEGAAMKVEAPPAADEVGLRPFCREDNSRYPVYRLNNDGADKGIDLAQRHVPSRGTFPAGKTGEDIVRDMIASGWIYEGHAFCN